MSIAEPSHIRALIIAEACNPEWTSVPLVGWSHYQALAKICNTHLVTQVRNKGALLRAGLIEGKDFTAIDSEAFARPAFRLAQFLRGGTGKGWTAVTAMAALIYPHFENLVGQQFARRLKAKEFDVVHRITPVSPTVTGSLAVRCAALNLPFILGPLNGGVPWPPQFTDARHAENEWLSYVREGYQLFPGYRTTRSSARAIVLGSMDTWEQIPQRYWKKCFYVAENAIDPGRFQTRRVHRAGLPLRAVFLGRMVPYKGADMLIEAAAPLIKKGALVLTLIGDGPEMPRLKELIAKLDLREGITLAGRVPHQEIHRWLSQADLLTFPSIREFGGAVVMEAMAVGVVPMVVGYGGPGEIVDESTGYRIPMGSRDELIQGFNRLLERLSHAPGEIDERLEACYAKARTHFTWDAKAHQVLQIYEWALGRGAAKPDFQVPRLPPTTMTVPVFRGTGGPPVSHGTP